MSTEIERIKHLHELASERYLNGDYQGAIEAWNDVLALDPADEQALGGIRMAVQFVEPASTIFAPGEPQIESELDEGLKILDGVGVPTFLGSDVAEDAIDRPAAAPIPLEAIPEGWEALTDATPFEQSFGLEPMARSSSGASAPASAAAAELKRRVEDLLAEARSKADAGERDDALAILARLSILDEDNAEAASLQLKIEAAGASDLDKVEQAIIEGVASLEADRLDDAERLFREALEIAPEHREALHYLEKVEQRRSAGTEDLLGGVEGEAAPSEDAVRKATGAQDDPPPQPIAPPKPKPAAFVPELPDAPIAAGRSRFALPSSRILIGGAIAAVVLIGGAMTLPRLFGKSKPKFTAPDPAAATSHAARAKAAAAKARAASPAATMTPEQRVKAVTSGLASGESLMASGDPGGAVIAFNSVLAIDPANTAARAGLAAAGERYKAGKAQRDAINNLKLAFRDGEFTSGLRMAYRLPPTVSRSTADAVKLAGWYNLAVVALRAGECREAQSHLDEALGIDGSDTDSKTLRELATRYADAVKDRSFFDRVEALSFRNLPPL